MLQCVRRLEWKIIAFIMQAQRTDICSWINDFCDQPGPRSLFSVQYKEQCFLRVAAQRQEQASTVYPAGHAHISQVHVHPGLLLFTGDTGVGIGLVGDV